MFKKLVSESVVVPNLFSLHISSRCKSVGVTKDHWGYPLKTQDKVKSQWKRHLPKPVTKTPSHILPVQKNEKILQSSKKLLEYLETERGLLKNLFEMECKERVSAVPYEPGLIRSGLIGRKQGETTMFLRNGEVKLCTVIEIPENCVVSCNPWYGKFRGRDDLHVMKIAAFDHEKIDEVPLVTQQEYLSVGIAPKMAEKFFLVSKENILPVGYKLDMSHFFVGQYIDIMGKSINRGFQGVIRRWGYKGQGNSRGRTKTHRRPGSISTQGLARVLKGKKMPGIMGNRSITNFSRHIVYANYDQRYIIVKGPILGAVGCFVHLADAIVKAPIQASLLHYPTFIPRADEFGHEIYDKTVIDPSERLETLLEEKGLK